MKFTRQTNSFTSMIYRCNVFVKLSFHLERKIPIARISYQVIQEQPERTLEVLANLPFHFLSLDLAENIDNNKKIAKEKRSGELEGI